MDKIKIRQLCFLFVAIFPVAKLFILPSAYVYYAKNMLLFSAVINMLIEGAVLFLVIFLSQKTELTFFQKLEKTFGKIFAIVLYVTFSVFFVYSAFIPLMEQKTFVITELYENVPGLLTFAPVFLVFFFECTKGIKSIGRIADISLPIFAIS